MVDKKVFDKYTDDENRPFPIMGKDWIFDNQALEAQQSIEDQIYLISNDGATLVCFDPKKRSLDWEFRNFIVPTIDPSIFRKIMRMYKEELFPFLKGAGTRRWSTFLAAFMTDILAVITVSQDGDIYGWHHSSNTKNLEDTYCLFRIDREYKADTLKNIFLSTPK